MERIPKLVWVLVFGAVLILPRLGSFGLWELSEIRYADVASELARDGTFSDITAGGKYAAGPVLPAWLSAVGFAVFGTSELAGRLPLALIGVLGLLLAFHLGRRMSDEWGGLAAAFVLGTTPGYLLHARQLGGDVVFSVAVLAAVGGLVLFVAGDDDRRDRRDLVIAALGLTAGALSRGILLGWLLPLVVTALGLVAFAQLKPTRSAQRPSLRAMVVAAWPGLWPVLLASGGVLALALVYLRAPVGIRAASGDALLWPRQGAWLVLGGVPRPITALPSFDEPLRDLGYAMFPWFALLPLALSSFGWSRRASEDERAESRLAGVTIGVAAAVGYLATVVGGIFFGPGHFPLLSLLALGVGLWLRRQAAGWRDPERLRWPFGALVAAFLLLALQQDFYVEPETLAFSHVLDKLNFPVKLDVHVAIRGFGWGLAALIFVALSGFGLVAPREGDGFFRRALRRAAEILQRVSVWARPMTLGAIVLFAGWCVQRLTPQLSLHMSNKALYQTYQRCHSAGDTELLGQYRVSGRGADYYTDGKVETLSSQTELFSRLRQPKRYFAVVPASQLGTLDQAARRQHLHYYVLDARNSKFLMISNRLAGQCSEDKNPLRKMVLSREPTTIKRRIRANFENRVALVGYDCPDVVRSGGSFKITLYFKVLARLPSNYKIFLHFDKPASRFHGDHQPLGEMYPTQFWLPGDYIVDTHEVELPLLTTSPGVYTIYTGFWLGSKRLKVADGPNDGSDRVRLGQVRVRVY